jgi:hypothetical protein
MKTASGFVKEALKMTARARVKRYLGDKKVPTLKAHELEDFTSHMVADSRRMATEAGKGPIVSKGKLWKKHTQRGGRFSDVKASFERARTFKAAPMGDPEGVKTVQFSTKPKAKAKVKAKPKAKTTVKAKKKS